MNSTPHPGAPQGNTNALKHGFYSRSFRATEQTGLADFDPASLANEIQLMRVFILRTAELGQQAATLAESMALLNVLSRAAISLGVLIRTQQALTLRKESADLADLTAQLNAANRRATALLKLLPPQPLDPPSEVPPTARRASYIPSPHASCSRRGDGSRQGEGSSLPPHTSTPAFTPQPAPEPTYTLGPENCLPSPKCFTCPDRTLCPDCQVYLRTHTPPKNDADRKIGEMPFSATGAAENGIPSAPVLPPPDLPSPLSLFYTLQPQSPNSSELFPPNNSPSQSPPST